MGDAPDKNGWRSDIENAPRDGTDVILYKRPLAFVCTWITESEFGPVWATADGHAILNPTHWQPLPAAPESSHD